MARTLRETVQSETLVRSSLSEVSSIDEEKLSELVDDVRGYLITNYANLIKVNLDDAEIKGLEKHIQEYIESNPQALDNISKQSIIRIIRERIVGFGVLEDIVKNPNVYEIHVKGTKPILVKEFGSGKRIYRDKYFKTDEQVYQMAIKLLQNDFINGQLSYANPEVESHIGEWRISATMTGYSHVNTITLRRQVVDMTPTKLIDLDTANEEMIKMLGDFQNAGLRTIVCGLPDCGKTGTMISLAHMLDHDTIVYTVEDTKELYIEKFLPYTTAYVVSSKDAELLNRKVTPSLAVKNVLNQGVEVLVIGQLRKNIAFATMEALNSGLHTLIGIHCTRPEDMINKFDNVLQYEVHKPEGYKKEIYQALDILVFQRRMSDWSVKMDIYEVLDDGLSLLYRYTCETNKGGVVKGNYSKHNDLSKKLKETLVNKGII